MKIKCYSVRLKSLVSISDRAFKAMAFDGSSAIIPKSQVFGIDNSVSKSDAYWISEWILEKKELQYSRHKAAIFDNESGRFTSLVYIEHHLPEKLLPVNTSPDGSLIR